MGDVVADEVSDGTRVTKFIKVAKRNVRENVTFAVRSPAANANCGLKRATKTSFAGLQVTGARCLGEITDECA